MLQQKNLIIVHAFDHSACAFVRQHAFSVLAECGMAGDFEIVRSRELINDDYLLAHTACVWISRPFVPAMVSFVEHYARKKGKHKFRIVADFDDLLWDVGGENFMTDYNKAPVDTTMTARCIERFAPKLDAVILSTEWLRRCWLARFKDACKKVAVVGNAIPRFLWGKAEPKKALPKKPVVLYGGATVCHYNGDNTGDFTENWLEWIASEKMEFHMFGDECPKWIGAKNVVMHPTVGAWQFPDAVRSIKPDLYIAPLKDNPFNRAKSNLKLLEASALGVPFVSSWWERFCPYSESAVRITPETEPAAFIEGLRDPETFRAVVDYQADLMESRGYWLESRTYRDKLLRVLLGDFLRIEG